MTKMKFSPWVRWNDRNKGEQRGRVCLWLLRNIILEGCSKMFRCKARKKPNGEAYIYIRWAVRCCSATQQV